MLRTKLSKRLRSTGGKEIFRIQRHTRPVPDVPRKWEGYGSYTSACNHMNNRTSKCIPVLTYTCLVVIILKLYLKQQVQTCFKDMNHFSECDQTMTFFCWFLVFLGGGEGGAGGGGSYLQRHTPFLKMRSDQDGFGGSWLV